MTSPHGVERLGYRPALDGIRAVAIALVVLYHASGWPASGWLGVDVFFVLSGFLITSLLLERGISFRDFYRRRARRLLPALVLMLLGYLAACMLLTKFRGHDLHRPVHGVLYALSYSQNMLEAFQVKAVTEGPHSLGHLWSLAVEEQFYLLWPFVLLLAGRRALRACVVLLVVCIVWRVWLLHDGDSSWRIFFGTDTRGESILIGCLFAALWRSERRKALVRVARITAPVAAVTVGAAALLSMTWRHWEEGPQTLFAFMCGLVVIASLDAKSWVAKSLSVAPARWLGRISYGLYLWHVPILVAFGVHGQNEFIAGAIPAVALSLVAASLSYYLVERPILRGSLPRLSFDGAGANEPGSAV